MQSQMSQCVAFPRARIRQASVLSRVLVSQDEDLLREGARRQIESKNFAGIV
jgi:hypothetical protein